MVAVTKPASDFRWERTLRGPKTLDEDLAFLGEQVGPRTGPDKRSHGQKEDYILRRLLVALREAGRIRFPVTVTAEGEQDGEPDFVASFEDGETVGLEITEAGMEDYQAWLTRTESLAESSDAVLLPGDVMAPHGAESDVAQEIADAIRKKQARFQQGKYRVSGVCDLVVYDNTAWGGYSDKRHVVDRLRRMNDLHTDFRRVHIVTDSLVVLDALGDDFKLVWVGNLYETDFAGWAFEQARRLRGGEIDRIDAENIAEELESLGKSDKRAVKSHLRNLLIHLLKWQYQSRRRGTSWELSVQNARKEIHDRLSEEPSLRGVPRESIEEVYASARQYAAREMRFEVSKLPASCPYAIDDVLDPEFFPGAAKKD